MDRCFRALRWSLIAILAVLCLQSAWELIVPPYSDEQIKSSFVDTWELHAWGTIVVLGFLALVTLCASPLAIWGHDEAARRFAHVIMGLSLCAAALAYSSHAALTARTTRLTGQTFSRCHGLL